VVRLGKGDPPTTPVTLSALTTAEVLDAAAESLRGDSLAAVVYASTTAAYAIGFGAESAMVSRLGSRLELPVVATAASAVLALEALEVERVALVGAPWFEPEWNELGAAYFRSQGFDVVFSRSAALPRDPDRIAPAAVGEWTAKHVGDNAEGVFIGGNGFRVVEAIESLEEAIGRPVVTSNQALLWNLRSHIGEPAEINGYGRLLAMKSAPPSGRIERGRSGIQ
jgi:maleate isomerase